MKKFLATVLCIGIIFMFSGCTASTISSQITKTVPSTISSKIVETTPTSAPTPTNKPMSAQDISSAMVNAKLHLGNVIVYTEETDVNKMLGRPGQYISKVNFEDDRLDQLDKDNPAGGSIETFNNSEDLNNRKEYIEGIEKKMPATMEYIYANGNYMLRLDKQLTPTQAKEYEEFFMTLK